jgi:hypothetical protein
LYKLNLINSVNIHEHSWYGVYKLDRLRSTLFNIVSVCYYFMPINLQIMFGAIKIFNIPLFFFFFFMKKNCKDLGVGHNLTEFAKILMPESLKKIYILKNTWVF